MKVELITRGDDRLIRYPLIEFTDPCYLRIPTHQIHGERNLPKPQSIENGAPQEAYAGNRTFQPLNPQSLPTAAPPTQSQWLPLPPTSRSRPLTSAPTSSQSMTTVSTLSKAKPTPNPSSLRTSARTKPLSPPLPSARGSRTMTTRR